MDGMDGWIKVIIKINTYSVPNTYQNFISKLSL